MRETSVRRNRHLVTGNLKSRASAIAKLIRNLALDNRGEGKLDAVKLYALQDLANDVAYPIAAIPSESNSPKGA